MCQKNIYLMGWTAFVAFQEMLCRVSICGNTFDKL